MNGPSALKPDWRGVRTEYFSLFAYALVQGVLLAGSVLLPFPASGLCTMSAMVSGLVVLTVQTLRRRPGPTWSWVWVVASGWLSVGVAVVAAASYGLRGGVNVTDWRQILLATVPLPILAIGLARFSWVAPRRGAIDNLDAVVFALAAFLVLWSVWLAPAFAVDLGSAAVAIVLPLGLLVVAILAVKIVLGGGGKDPPVALVVVAAASVSTTSVALLVPGLETATLPATRATNVIWACFGVAVGAAALHPDLSRPRTMRGRQVDDTSLPRTLLFAGLALVPLGVWTTEAFRLPTTAVGRIVPIVASAALLLSLVLRMAIVARVAQQHAAALGRRKNALAAAVAEQKKLQRQLAYRATHDPLTDLYSRSVLIDRMQAAFASQRDGPGHALLLFDLDRFKEVNDTFGHPVGDRLLIEAARRLERGLSDNDLLARLGGDEFALFLENTSEARAVACAADMLERLRPLYSLEGHEFAISASVGVFATQQPATPPTPDEALSDADLALYSAKDLGRDRVRVFRPELRTSHLVQARLVAGLRRALRANQFLLHYQPIVELESGVVVAVEALLRWRQAEGQLISPEIFLPVAEDAGLILPIGEWVMRQAIQDARRWYSRHKISVFVNVSGRQLDSADFTASVVGALADANLPSDAVVLEITEASFMTASPADARFRQLHALRDNKIRLAIDDFGTGYSSLSYVAHLPLDYVKIDKSLTQASVGPAAVRPWSFTRAVVDMIASLQLAAIAEGVETGEQVEALRATGCAYAQGYYFGRPVEAGEIDELLSR